VTEPRTHAKAEGGAPPPAATAGALLGAAREASGLSIDAVAQQLKLAPRQVRALEEGDYTHLPGRTFVRGFIRNYARLVGLDPDKVLRALPAGAAAPALEAPTLQETAPTIGELPATDRAKVGWARWAIPLILASVVAAAAVYEWMRPAGDARVAPATDAGVETPAPAPTPPPPDQSAMPLPNPLAATKSEGESSPAPASDQATVTATPAAASTASAPGASTASAPGVGTASAPGVGTASAPAARTAATAAEQPLVITFADYSWTEIRDRDGRVLLHGMNSGGTAKNLSGTPPFDIVIGNAADVRLTYKGNPVDLAPHTRQNVARFRLP
jgi:cytoskeleton protein RodZ